MDKQLQRFAQGLLEASRLRDWQALIQLDGELAALLRQWSSDFRPSAAERQALEALKQAHAQARALCGEELDGLVQTLEQMRQGRERWSAYAASAGWSVTVPGALPDAAQELA